MNKLSRIAMRMGLGTLAVVAAAPAFAGAQQAVDPASPAAELPANTDSAATPTTRVKRVGTRMETVIVVAGAVDPHGRRWLDSGGRNPVLPTVSESAFLDGE